MYKLFLLIILSFILTACGFHLRGYQPLPNYLQTLKLVTPTTNNQLAKQLEKALQSNGVQLVSSGKVITLEIMNEEFNQQISSIGSGGQNTVYLLSYTINYQLLDSQGELLLAPEKITTTRNYSVGSNQILGDTYVENDLRTEMRRDVIYQLLNRLKLYQPTLSPKSNINTSQNAITP